MTYATTIFDRLLQSGWKYNPDNMVAGVQFDHVLEKKLLMTSWSLFIKEIPLLDDTTALLWQQNFTAIRRKHCRGSLIRFGKPAIFLLITQDASPEALVGIKSGRFGEFARFNPLGYQAASVLLVSDMKEKVVWKVEPKLADLSINFVQDVVKILEMAFTLQ